MIYIFGKLIKYINKKDMDLVAGIYSNRNFSLLTYKLIKRSLLSYMADPTYMVRAIPSNASDNVYCTLLAQSAVHGAMAGYTGFTVGLVNGRHTYIPFNVSHIPYP